VRAAQEARQYSFGRAGCRRTAGEPAGDAGAAPTSRAAARSAGRTDAGRARGDRNGLLLRSHLRGSRGPARRAPGHGADANPHRVAEAQEGPERRSAAMSFGMNEHGPEHSELAFLYALQALPPVELAAAQAHVAACP